jgi:hypothetical protein
MQNMCNMKYTKSTIIKCTYRVGAFADTVFTLLTDNASLLIDIGLQLN